jgi:uncharacterized protein (DUF433 family)
MSETAADYVFRTPEGGWRIAGSRVSLDSIVHAYWAGQSPEAIAEDFPTLSLEQVYGAIAFYLRHRREMDEYLAAQEARWEQLRQESEAAHGPLLSRIRGSRHKSSTKEGPA